VSIIEPPYDPEDFDLSTEGGMAYARGAIIEAGVREGYSIGSVRQALSGFGISFAGAQVSSVYNVLSENIAAGQTAAALSVDAATGQVLSGSPPDGWTGQYVHQVSATFRTQGTTGEYELRTRTMGIKSSELLDPFDAMAAATQIIETPVDEDDEDTYGSSGDLLSLSLSGVWYDTRPGVLSGRFI
jgi:hypothetical protein